MPRRPSGPAGESLPLRRARLARNWTLENVGARAGRSGKFGAQLTRLENAGFTAFIHLRNDNGVIPEAKRGRSASQTGLHNAQLMHSVTAVNRLA